MGTAGKQKLRLNVFSPAISLLFSSFQSNSWTFLMEFDQKIEIWMNL